MKLKHLLAVVSIGLTATMHASTGIPKLIDALIRVESGGRANAIGDRGKALGILQIHSATVQEANRIAGTRFTHRDMLDPAKAKRVATIVLGHYSSHILNTTGRTATNQELAFIWNGGGSAWKRANSPVADSKQRNLQRYWNKVSVNL